MLFVNAIKIKTIILVSILFTNFIYFSNAFNKFEFKDDDSFEFLLNGIYTYEDGTVLLAGVKNSKNSATYGIHFRIIHNVKDKTFKSFNVDLDCRGCVIREIIPLTTNYILIFKQDRNLTGMIVNWNGELMEDKINIPLSTNYFKFFVYPNLENEGVFLIALQYNETSNNLLYFEYNKPDQEGKVSQNRNGLLKLPENFGIAFWDIIPIEEYKYGIIYYVNNPSAGGKAVSFDYLFEETQSVEIGFKSVLSTTFWDKLQLIKCNTDSKLNTLYCVLLKDDEEGEIIQILWLQIDYSINNNVNVTEDKLFYFTKFGNKRWSLEKWFFVFPLKHKRFLFSLTINLFNDVNIIVMDPKSEPYYCELNPPFHFNVNNFSILPNNILVIATIDEKGWILRTKDISQILEKTGKDFLKYPYYQVNPTNNSLINKEDTINLSFPAPVILSENQALIYQQGEDGSQILRQYFTKGVLGNSLLDDGNTLSLPLYESTFNSPNSVYYLVIEKDLAIYKRTGEKLLPSNWILITPPEGYVHSGSVGALLRLTVEGTKYFNELNDKGDKKEFLIQMQKELCESIPLHISQLLIDDGTTYDKFDQILISITINPSDTNNNKKRNTKQFLNDLNKMIQAKYGTPLMFDKNTTIYLDQMFGAKEQYSLWDSYKYIVMGYFCGIFVVGLIYLMARLKHKEGNNLIIFKISLIGIDFISDILFIINNGNDVPELYIPSIIFVIIPIVLNTVLSFRIIISECSTNDRFSRYLKCHTQPVAMITLLSGSDVVGLLLLSSNFAGLKLFSAKFSEKAEDYIYWGSVCNLFIEDLPQLFIQIVYLNRTISDDVILSLLSLTTGSIILISNILEYIYDIYLKLFVIKKDKDPLIIYDNRPKLKHRHSF